MKKLMISLLTVFTMLVTVSTNGMANGNGQSQQKKMQNPRAVPMTKATILQDGKNKMYCTVCGMTLPMFYKTNHAATDEKGKVHQYCSIVCELEDEVKNGRKLHNRKVIDNTTLKFIDVNTAYFVVGSKMPGTMSVVSKYAFGTKEAADKLVAKKGGKVMRFDALYAFVVKSQAKDMQATKMRQAKAIKKGGMMYKKMCKKTNKRFASTADAKSFLMKSGICGKIKGKKHQAIALYLNSRK